MATLGPAHLVEPISSASQLTCSSFVDQCAPQPSQDNSSIERMASTARHKAGKAGSGGIFYSISPDVMADPDEEDSDCLSSLHSSDADDSSSTGEVEPAMCAAILACRLSREAGYDFALGIEPSLEEVSACSPHDMSAPAVRMTGQRLQST
eukprot:gene12166-15279_t